MALSSVFVFLAFVYAGIMLAYFRGWRAIPEWPMPEDWAPDISVTVVVAARNEAGHIISCLESIVNGSYPAKLLEIIVIDDFSDDKTAFQVQQFIGQENKAGLHGTAIKLLQLSRLELVTAIQAELEENPVLEEGTEAGDEKAQGEALAEGRSSQPEGLGEGLPH